MKPLNLQLLLDVLLDCNSELPLRKKVLDEFVEYCALITDIDADVTFNAFAPDTHLPSGMAINPQAAAMCVTDYGRTTAFIRAVHDAMEYLLAQTRSNALTTSQTLNVLYAGCGPYATLMLAIIVKFQEHSIKFHLLDIHQSSLDSVQILLRHFGVDVQKIQFFCADACEFKPKIKFDLIVAETMQKALEQEPQFQLTVNLKQYLTEKGVFIPEAIQLQLALIRWKQELEITLKYKQKLLQADIKQFDRVLIGGGLTLSIDSVDLWLEKHNHSVGGYLDFGQISLPYISGNIQYDVAILTEITLFKGHKLKEYESDLTLPTKMHEASPAVSQTNYQLIYQLGNYPKFELNLK